MYLTDYQKCWLEFDSLMQNIPFLPNEICWVCFSLLLFSEDWTPPFNRFSSVYFCLCRRWVPSQPSTRSSSHLTMRRCSLVYRWRGGQRRRYLSWPLVAREITWLSSASQVATSLSLSAFEFKLLLSIHLSLSAFAVLLQPFQHLQHASPKCFSDIFTGRHVYFCCPDNAILNNFTQKTCCQSYLSGLDLNLEWIFNFELCLWLIPP